MNRVFRFLRDSHEGVYKFFLILTFISLVVYLFPQEAKFRYEFQEGKPWLHNDLVAPFDFAIKKSDAEINQEKERILEESRPYFKLDNSIFVNKIRSFEADIRNKLNAAVVGGKLTKQRANALLGIGSDILDTIYLKGVIEMHDVIDGKPDDYTVFVINYNVAEEVELRELFTIQEAYDYVQKSIQRLNANERRLLSSSLQNAIAHNIFYDKETTDRAITEEIENISLTRDMKRAGEKIISRGEFVDDEKFIVLESLREEYLKQIGGTLNYFFIIVGQFILVSCSLLIIILFLWIFRVDVFVNNRKITFILLMILLIVLLTTLTLKYNIGSIYLIPFCILPVVIRAFFDTRIALFSHLVTTLIIGLIAPNPFEFAFIQLISGNIAIFSIINMRKRSQLFISVAIIFLAYTVTFLGISIMREGHLRSVEWINIAWFGTSAMLTLFAYPLLFVFEKMFGFISDVSLMEISDINTPLLREFAVKAPGTFQHSLQVAHLAEEAIIAIGGNTLLVRAGSLYHDIGKIDMPLYFIENQLTGVNPHDELSYEESASIITSHVIRGIEKAKKNNLPDQVIDFIRTHHGTTKAQYFYQSFLKNFPNEKVDERAFQYPGPKPFSKETAVLMMADSVEAASRSLKKIDSDIIDQLVENVIDDQIKQRQFDNADITFRNIRQIKKLFKKKLTNIYHLRIEYPK